MVITVVDDGAKRRIYSLTENELSKLIEGSEGSGLEIEIILQNDVEVSTAEEVLKDFGSLGLLLKGEV